MNFDTEKCISMCPFILVTEAEFLSNGIRNPKITLSFLLAAKAWQFQQGTLVVVQR